MKRFSVFEEVESIAINIMLRKPNLTVPDHVNRSLARLEKSYGEKMDNISEAQ